MKMYILLHISIISTLCNKFAFEESMFEVIVHNASWEEKYEH